MTDRGRQQLVELSPLATGLGWVEFNHYRLVEAQEIKIR